MGELKHQENQPDQPEAEAEKARRDLIDYINVMTEGMTAKQIEQFKNRIYYMEKEQAEDARYR